MFAAAEDETELPECKQRPKGMPFDCCKMPKFMTKLDGKLKTCVDEAKAAGVVRYIEHNSYNRAYNKTEQFQCAHKCMFDNNEVLTADNQFDRDAVLSYLGTLFADADAGFTDELHSKNTDECITKIEEAASLFKDLPQLDDEKRSKKDGKCSFKPGMLKMCLHHKYMSNCPATAWNECEFSHIALLSILI